MNFASNSTKQRQSSLNLLGKCSVHLAGLWLLLLIVSSSLLVVALVKPELDGKVEHRLVHNANGDTDDNYNSDNYFQDKFHQIERKPHYLQHHVNRKQLDGSELDYEDTKANQFSNGINRLRGHQMIRLKRATPSRGKSPRVQLAQLPQRSTTSTTTTSTTTPEASLSSTKETPTGTGGEIEVSGDEVEEDEDSSGDYEEIQEAPKKGSKGVGPSGRISSGSVGRLQGGKLAAREEASSEDAEESVEEMNEEVGPKTTTKKTTTTTTTTVVPSTTRRVVASGASGKGSRKDRQRAATASTSGSASGLAKNSIKASKPKQVAGSTTRSSKDLKTSNNLEDYESQTDTNPMGASTINETQYTRLNHGKKKPLLAVPFIRPKNASACTREAFLEFPRDIIGDKWRSRGLILVHIAIVCYMFYSLALVCERYFMPSLEEFAQRLNLSEDVAGATLMSAGSSAPELFTAILGVFVAKGDVGTGTIVGSAVFNILFVIGICAFVSTTSAQLQWWPVLRDSVYYAFTVLVLIVFIYDERITGLESFTMLALYGLYILIMVHNESLKGLVTKWLLSNPFTAKLLSSTTLATIDGPDDVFGSSSSAMTQFPGAGYQSSSIPLRQQQQLVAKTTNVEDDSVYLAALLVIIKHKRLFRSTVRFQSATRYVIVKRQHRAQRFQEQQQKATTIRQSDEVNYFGPDSEPLRGGGGGTGGSGQKARMEAYAKSASLSKQKFSIVSKEDYEFWNRPPVEGENYYLWMAKIPVNYVLHYSIPDCSLYPDKYLATFIVSILWTALFSYIMVWMVTLIGYTFGIPDSVMGAVFLAAGTSVPDCYSSVHAARNGMADMAVSNSIGSNVFDILIGLSLPWFIQTTIYPQVVATINSRGVIYSVILLFLSLIVTIYLLNKYEWTLKPRLGLALLIAYGLFIILTCMLEFNLFGHVNPPSCPIDT